MEKDNNSLVQALCHTLACSWFLGKSVVFTKEEEEELNYNHITHCRLNSGVDWFLVNHSRPASGTNEHRTSLLKYFKKSKDLTKHYLLVEVIDNELHLDYERTVMIPELIGTYKKKKLKKQVEKAYLGALTYIVENSSKYKIDINTDKY
jgi:hypothetical protein